MADTEICRLILGWDARRPEKRWWEARMVKARGEPVVHRVEFVDQQYSAEAAKADRIDSPYLKGPVYLERRRSMSTELEERALDRLVDMRLTQGWQTMSTDADERVITMKRRKEKGER